MTVQGDGQIIRNPDTGGDSGRWRGLSMTLSADVTVTTGTRPVPYDNVLADTDTIQSTSINTFGSRVVPAGAAGVVPAGMGGLWRLSANTGFQADGGLSGVTAFVLVVNNFEWTIVKDVGEVGDPLPSQFSIAVAPIVRRLSEGDVVWGWVQAPVASVVEGASEDAVVTSILMEYLIPWALDDT